MRKQLIPAILLLSAAISLSACQNAPENSQGEETSDGSAGSTGTGDSEGTEISGILDFSFSYTQGDYAYSGNSYSATLEDGTVSITIYRDGDPDPYTFTADPEFLDRLTEAVNESGAAAWNGFDQTNQDVLDGDSFSLYITTDGGETISADGYASFPQNFSDAAALLEQPFVEIYESFHPNQEAILQAYLDK